ncbi:MAG: AAA family ATPase [Iphinoe sp. HA4291-MV1]|jgi:exodeoxyribonuclease-5|nr:AAA family ATPase [Iphinoe sp. HA4291-MV1]
MLVKLKRTQLHNLRTLTSKHAKRKHPALEILGDAANSLSSDQLQAVILAHDWFTSNPREPFILRGFAGTGKTFCVHRIIQMLQKVFVKRQVDSALVEDDEYDEYDDDCFDSKDEKVEIKELRVALCAPTHKARAVLETSAHEASLKNVSVSTLHSLLHVMPGDYDEHGKRKLIPNTWTNELHYRSFDLVIIDEASMVGVELYELISRQVTPTMLMGDPAQLPPVEDALPESPVFSLPVGIELTQVMRYEGAIAEYVTQLRNNIDKQFPPRLYTKGNITKMQPDDWLQELINRFQRMYSEEKRPNPNHLRALAWTNKRVEVINKIVRDDLYGWNSDPFVSGEILMAKDAILKWVDQREKKSIVMHSCQECEVISVKPGNIRMMFTGTPIDIFSLEVQTDTGKEIELVMIHPDNWDYMKAYLLDFRKSITKKDDLQEKKKLWRQWYEMLELYNLSFHGNAMMHRLQYAYALTVHQSQGSTFNNVFVDTANIFGCRENRLRNQLLYVAYSRASEHLYVSSKI